MGNVNSKIIRHSIERHSIENEIVLEKKSSEININFEEHSEEFRLSNIEETQIKFSTNILDIIKKNINENLKGDGNFLEVKKKVEEIIPLDEVELQKVIRSIDNNNSKLQHCLDHYCYTNDIKQLDCFNSATEVFSNYLSTLSTSQINFIIETLNTNSLFLFHSMEGILLVKLGVLSFFKCSIYFMDEHSNSFKIFVKESLDIRKNTNKYFYRPVEIAFKTIKKYKYTIATSSTVLGSLYFLFNWNIKPSSESLRCRDVVNSIPKGQGLKEE